LVGSETKVIEKGREVRMVRPGLDDSHCDIASYSEAIPGRTNERFSLGWFLLQQQIFVQSHTVTISQLGATCLHPSRTLKERALPWREDEVYEIVSRFTSTPLVTLGSGGFHSSSLRRISASSSSRESLRALMSISIRS
jgi:hypothetical protein